MPSANDPGDSVRADLVEYFVMSIPGSEAVSPICDELVRLVDNKTLRILDLVILCVGSGGTLETVEADAVESLTRLTKGAGWLGGVASRHDISLVASSLPPGTTAVMVVAEDRWAERLSTAASAIGGSILAGERIGPDRVEAALERAGRDEV
jgi:hypothetical protein